MKTGYIILIVIAFMLFGLFAILPAQEVEVPIDTSKYAMEKADLILGYNQLNAQKLDIEKRMENIIYTIQYMNNFETMLKAKKDSTEDKQVE